MSSLSVSVLVPYRPDGADRDRAWAWLRPRWVALGWQVVEGSPPPAGEWVKALAVRDALSRASGDVLVLADCDVWCPGVSAAVDVVAAGAAWAAPHTLVYRLTRAATGLVYEDGRFAARAVEQRPYQGMIGGGCTVVRRDVYESCPLDPRFKGWGQEDAAWGVALTAMYGPPWRSVEPLWHLWHAPQGRIGLTDAMMRGECAPPRGTGSMAGRRLLQAYRVAAESGRMREFLAQCGAETMERVAMWRYRNKNSGDIHEFPTENGRLSRLGNWELLSRPDPEPLRDDDFRRILTEPAPVVPPAVAPAVVVDRPVETVTLPESVDTFVLPDIPDPAPVDDSDLTARPSVRASVAEWRSYGRTAGLGDRVDSMTKAQIISHYRQ